MTTQANTVITKGGLYIDSGDGVPVPIETLRPADATTDAAHESSEMVPKTSTIPESDSHEGATNG